MTQRGAGVKTAGRIYDGLLLALAVIAMAILPVMALAVTFEVVMRYVFNEPTIWVIDASAFSLLWITFFAAPWLVRQNGHIRIEFFVSLLPQRQRTALLGVTSLVAAVVSALLLYFTLTGTWAAWVRGVNTIGSWEIPRAFVWVAMPIGSFFLVTEFLRQAVVAFRDLRRGGREDALAGDAPRGEVHGPV